MGTILENHETSLTHERYENKIKHEKATTKTTRKYRTMKIHCIPNVILDFQFVF